MLWTFNIFTLGGWPDNGLINYEASKGLYKVFSADPNDRIVQDISSIKSGIALNLVKKQLGWRDNKFQTKVSGHLLTEKERRNLTDDLQ